ncbi:MAG: DUF1566 domain-containing protein [Geobacter sp.]|nr:DUF1566 domain-containing protein [Geobacter sp.]
MKKLAISMVVFCSIMALSVAAWCGDNGNGTVTIGNLVVLKDAGCLGYMNWDTAMSRPKSLADGQCDLTDKSKPGDWRLPTVDELQNMHASKSQFKNVQAGYYWSGSIYIGNIGSYAWIVYMYNGHLSSSSLGKGKYNYVWPVRGGQ